MTAVNCRGFTSRAVIPQKPRGSIASLVGTALALLVVDAWRTSRPPRRWLAIAHPDKSRKLRAGCNEATAVACEKKAERQA